MILLEDFPNFTLWHDPAEACLYATWQGKHCDDLTRVYYGLVCYHIGAMGTTKLLIDGLLDEDGWPQAVCWLAKEYFPSLALNGLQVIAWVLPRCPEALYDTARVLANLQCPVVDTFTDVQAAHDWLHLWPFPTPLGDSELPLTVATFLLLPPAQQLAFTQQKGCSLSPRWETDYFIKSYQVLAVLRVDILYHLHSGALHQLRVHYLHSLPGA